MSAFDSVDHVRPHRLWDGIVARSVRGERMTFAVVDLEPGVTAPEHRHGNEQLGLVLRGSVTMVVDGEARTLHAGEVPVPMMLKLVFFIRPIMSMLIMAAVRSRGIVGFFTQ